MSENELVKNPVEEPVEEPNVIDTFLEKYPNAARLTIAIYKNTEFKGVMEMAIDEATCSQQDFEEFLMHMLKQLYEKANELIKPAYKIQMN